MRVYISKRFGYVVFGIEINYDGPLAVDVCCGRYALCFERKERNDA